MKEKIKLKDNHRRVFSVVLNRTEKSIDEILELLNSTVDETTYVVLREIGNDEIENKKKAAREVKILIKSIYDIYDLKREKMILSNIINAKKTMLWSWPEDIFSKKLNKYGDFIEEYAEEFDRNITELIRLIDKI